MRIKTIQTFQGHPVPSKVTPPRGPFPPELLRGPEIVTDYEPDDGYPYEPGATAQNNYKPPRWYRCNTCQELVTEDELASHTCPEPDQIGDPQ